MYIIWRGQRNFIRLSAHLCSYSTFQFRAFARLSPRTVRTNSLPDLILISCFNPSGSILPTVNLKKNNNNNNNNLGRRISHISGDDREVLFILDRISATIQRFNSVLLHDFFLSTVWTTSHSAVFNLQFSALGIVTTRALPD